MRYRLALWIARKSLWILRLAGWINVDAALLVRKAIAQGYIDAIKIVRDNAQERGVR